MRTLFFSLSLASAIAATLAIACGEDGGSTYPDDANGSKSDSGDKKDSDLTVVEDDSSTDALVGPGQIVASIRDFKFYKADDSTTNPDFENPPFDIGNDGQPSPGFKGDWNDFNIVEETIGADSKPVYKGKTVTTHSKAAFDQWYRDVPNTNVRVEIPINLTRNADGSSTYDSNVNGQFYDPTKDAGDRGFFPIDDGTPFATSFGNQGVNHNFSFTVEIHTVFTFKGGEFFKFRGDDDVWVFINKKRVIDLGGIHGPKEAQVNVDTVGLVVGQTYALDFFSAERHQGGSNVLFQTTLALQPRPN